MQLDHPIAATLMQLMFPLFRFIKSEFKLAFARSPLTLTQFRILMVVRMGVQQVGKVADLLDVSQPAASKMVDSLVKNGYLKRVPNPADRRQVLLTTTAKANQAVDAMRVRVLGKIGDEILNLPSADQRILQEGVGKLAAVMMKVAANAEAQEVSHAR